MTEKIAPYEFEYAMSRLKDAIDYAFQTGEFEGVRLWAMNVEESHKAEVKDMQETISSADEGLKLFHSIASNGEQSVLSRLDNSVDAVDAQRWQDEPAIEDITVNGYAFNSNHAKIENDVRQKLADEYNKLFAK